MGLFIHVGPRWRISAMVSRDLSSIPRRRGLWERSSAPSFPGLWFQTSTFGSCWWRLAYRCLCWHGSGLTVRDATFAAVLYAVNPYHLVIVYWRSAFAELLASSLLPLLILLLLRTEEKGRRVTIFLAFLLAASWLINAPAAVMVHYSARLAACGDRLAAAVAKSGSRGIGCDCSGRGAGRILFTSGNL